MVGQKSGTVDRKRSTAKNRLHPEGRRIRDEQGASQRLFMVEQGLIQGHRLMAMLFLARMVPITSPFRPSGYPIPGDGWIAVLLSVLATIPVALWIVWLGLSFPGKTIVEYEILFRKVVGKLLGLGLILFFLGKGVRLLGP